MKILDTITSIEKFQQIVDEIRERRAYTQAYGFPYRHEFYRGQLDSSWSIIPSLSRGFKTVEAVKDAEKKVMDLFKTLLQKKGAQNKIFQHQTPKAFQNEWLLLGQAQHLGVPTRLLDWTIHPEVALYFSVDNGKMDDVDGQFLVMYVPGDILKTDATGEEQYYGIHYSDQKDTWFINPSFFHHAKWAEVTPEIRRARQHGKFSQQSYDLSLSGLDNQPALQIPWNKTFDVVIEKYVIPAEFKPQIRLDLIAKGWHGEYLYADDDPVLNEIRDKCKDLRNSLL